MNSETKPPIGGKGGERKEKYSKIKFFLALVCLLLLAYFLGPRPSKPDFSSLTLPVYSSDLRAVEDSIVKSEATFLLKPDNEARIIWAKPYEKTPYAIVYMPGNGATQEEGDPIHEALAHRYGCNMFLARLHDHGLVSDDPLLENDPVEWMQSALDAVAVGRQIGDKVILVSCSTGSTLAMYLSALFPDLTIGQIMLSPNVDVYDPRSSLLTLPWGLQIARLSLGSKFYGWEAPGQAQRYWYTRYRAEGLVSLKSLINATMTDDVFKKIDEPVCIAYYYLDEANQDDVVSVKRMREMYNQLGTPMEKKREIVLGDAGTHIVGSDFFNSNLGSLWHPLTLYCEEVLQLIPVHDTDWKPFIDER